MRVEETIRVEGIVRIREIPREWDYATYAYWWLPEVDAAGRVLRPPRMREREKQRYEVAEQHNTLTNAGRALFLDFLSSPTAINTIFAQYFAVGTTSLISVSPGDGAVQGEIARAVPSAFTISNAQADLASYFGPAQALGTLTNGGLYGNNATNVLGSGTLYSHVLLNYTKGSVPITIDYLFNLQ